MASGKLFRSDPAHTNELRGVLYSNLDLLNAVRTNAGSLVPTHDRGARTLVYELEEHMEHPKDAGVLASRGIHAYLSDFAVITAFGLNAICTPDPDLQRRLLFGPPSPTTGVMPKKFASTTFSEQVLCTQPQADQFADFVDHLIGLQRKVFLDVMRAIRTYVTGMYRLGDDLDAAYTLLSSSLEPLLRHFHVNEPTWDDYPENRRRPMDQALRDADDGTRRDVQKALLDLDGHTIGRRLRLFVDANLDSSFFRDEASEAVSPIERSGLHRRLGLAYALRSNYLHASKSLPLELTLVPRSGAEATRVVGKGTLLTFEGLSRLVRHVIRQFVARQESIATEPCDYSAEEPGVVTVELSPEYWLHRPGDFTAKDGQKRLFAFCGQLVVGIEKGEPPKVSDLRDTLKQSLGGLASMKPKNRLPFLALHYLFNVVTPADEQSECGSSRVVQLYGAELEVPSIEAMLLALLVNDVPPWPLEDHEEALRTYLDGRGRDNGMRIHSLLEVGITLELAERYRLAGCQEEARSLVRLALENRPGNEPLIRFERELDLTKPIRWQEVMELSGDCDSNDN